MKQKEIVFSRSEKINGWMGILPSRGKAPTNLVFPESTAASVLEYMHKKYPKVRVGFNSSDFSPAIEQIYGPVFWMTSTGEQAA